MASDNTAVLTKAQIEEYKQQGFIIIKQLFSADECDELNRNAIDMVTEKVPLGEGNSCQMEPDALALGLVTESNADPQYLFKIGHRMHITDPVFHYFAVHNKIAGVLNSLIGSEIKCVQSMYIDKPKKIGVGQPYHQDSHYIEMDPDTLVGVWIALDDVDVANGCLHVIPGSHRETVHPHEAAIDERQRQLYLEVHEARERFEVACQIPKGGAVFFPGTMLHRSGNNTTLDRQRRAYVLHYADAASTQNYQHKLEQHLAIKKTI